MNYWLMKSEPTTYGIEDLAGQPDQRDYWDGVRNYQARNMMRDDMQLGDLAFFYHSNCTPPGVTGIIEIVKSGYPDETAFDPDSPYYDEKSTLQNPRWYRVDVALKRQLKRQITLSEIKNLPNIEALALVQKGCRLSIMPVKKDDWDAILSLETSKL